MTGVRRTADEQAADRFHRHLRPLLAQDLAEDLFPSWLARAAQLALGADGAGLSIVDERHRIPVGASGPDAASAERLQFTLGQGPCIDALNEGRGVRVDEAEMIAHWPPFHAELVDVAPYRSVVAVPMALRSGLRGALDVYFETSTMPAYSVVTEAESVAGEVSRLLDHVEEPAEQRSRWDDGELPSWVFGPQARHRLRVWLAVGIVVAELDVATDAALALLRAHAYARGLDIDAVTVDVVSGAVRVADLHGA